MHRLAKLAPLALVFVGACQVPPGSPGAAPTPGGSGVVRPLPSAAVAFNGDMTATFTRLQGYPATPSPIAANTVSGQVGAVTVIKAQDQGRSVELRIADQATLAPGNVYGVDTPAKLDPTGAMTGASLVYTGPDGSWTSVEGSLTIDLIAGKQIGCYFKGVTMSPNPRASGGFDLDGQTTVVLTGP